MKLIPNQTYCFRRGLDAYFCLAGRVQVANGACCEYRENRFYFPAVHRYLPDEAARLIAACPERYIVAGNPQKKEQKETL